jgi:galactonate dehydratase
MRRKHRPDVVPSNSADLDRVVRAVKAARDKVGPGGAVMFDAHCGLLSATVIQPAAVIEPYDLLFLEEPAVPGNVEVFQRIKRQVRVPLAAGERDRTVWEFVAYLEQGCLPQSLLNI